MLTSTIETKINNTSQGVNMKNEKKEKALGLLGEGLSLPKIAKLLKVSRVSVWKWAQQYESAGLLVRIYKKPAIYRSMLPPSEASDGFVNPAMLGSMFRESIPLTKKNIFVKFKKEVECCNCGHKKKESLQIHHIDLDRKDNQATNLSILCANCHTSLHKGNEINVVPISEALPKRAILNHRNLIHTAHRLKFSIEYTGKQPFRGATEVKPFGRYGTARQNVFKLGRITIVAFKHKLNVWVHRPSGKLTRNQEINAKRDAYLSLLAFTEAHSIKIKGDLSAVLRSHHVVKDKGLNEALKPIIEAHPEEIEARIGSKVCKSSHPGKVEHEGVSKELTGAHVAKNLEYLVTLFPSQFGEMAQAQAEYNKNIKLHLGVLREMEITLKEIRAAL